MIRNIIFFFICCGAHFIMFSQTDSTFEERFERFKYYADFPGLTSKAKTDSIRLYSGIEEELLNPAFNQVYQYIENKITRLKSDHSKFYWLFYSGKLRELQGDAGGANLDYLNALELANSLNDPKKVQQVYIKLVMLYYSLGLNELAIEAAHGLYIAAEESGDSLTLRKSINFSSWFISDIGFSEGIPAYQDSAVNLLTKNYVNTPDLSKDRELVFTYSLALSRSGNRPEAIKVLEYTLGVLDSNDFMYKTRFLEQLIVHYAVLENKEKSLECVKRLYEIDDSLQTNYFGPKIGLSEDDTIYLNSQMYIFRAYQVFEMYDRVIELGEGIKRHDSLQFPTYYSMEIDKFLANAYLNIGDYKKASKTYHDLYEKTLKNKNEEIRDLRKVEADHSKAQIQIEKTRAAKVEEQQQLIIEKEENNNRNIIVSFSLGSAGLIFFLLILYSRYKKSKKQKQLIQKQKKEVEHQRNLVLDSIHYAKTVQQSILPNHEKIKSHFKSFRVWYYPRDIVSGDFYWFHNKNDISYLALSDCTGHGVPGAFMSLIGASVLRLFIIEKEMSDLSEILEKMDQEMIKRLKQKDIHANADGMDIALVKIDHNSGEIFFASAHQEIYLIKNNEIVQESGTARSIGGWVKNRKKLEPFSTKTFSKNDIDGFFLVTDGLEDQFGGPNNEKFSRTNLIKLLNLAIENDDLVENKINEWRENNDQIDDISVVKVML